MLNLNMSECYNRVIVRGGMRSEGSEARKDQPGKGDGHTLMLSQEGVQINQEGAKGRHAPTRPRRLWRTPARRHDATRAKNKFAGRMMPFSV